MATDDDDAATLRERVRELEQTVAQQQDTIEQLMPSRRAILAGGAGLVGGAALTGQASAQSAAGQIGTSSEPVDVEAATVSADSVNAGKTNGVITPEPGEDIAQYVANGVSIYLSPNAEYELSSPIDADKGFILDSLGALTQFSGTITDTGPTINYTGAGPYVVDWSDTSVPKIECAIRNVSFDCGGVDTGIYGRYLTDETHFENVVITNASGTGVDIQKAFHAWGNNVVVLSPCSDYGIRIHGTGDNAVTHFPMLQPRTALQNTSTAVGISVEGGCRPTMFGPISESCGQEAMILDGVSATLIHPYVENFGANMTTPVGISVTGGAEITGGTYSGVSGGRTIDVTSGAKGSIRGGRFFGSASDYHIHNNSESFTMYNPHAISNAATTSFENAGDGLAIELDGTWSGPNMRVDAGEWFVYDGDTNETQIS